MTRAAVLALVAAFVLVAAAEAQRAGGGARHGGGIPMGIGGRHPSPQNGFTLGRQRFRHFHDNDSVFIPYGVYDPYWYEQPNAEVVMDPKSPLITPQPREVQSRLPEIPAAASKLIEIPGVPNSPAAKVQPAIFVLMDGYRLETSRYVLTAEKLSVTIDRKQTTIPVSMLDLNATISANRERGIELRIPEDRNEISLSF
jgi:hypothetical protein